MGRYDIRFESKTKGKFASGYFQIVFKRKDVEVLKEQTDEKEDIFVGYFNDDMIFTCDTVERSLELFRRYVSQIYP